MRNADWSRWSAIAEIVSSAAILITLVYLAIQTQQNTQALTANGRQAALQIELDYLGNTLSYPEIYSRPVNAPDDGLDRETRVRMWVAAIVLARMREATWLQHQSGSLDEGTWNGYLSQFLSELEVNPYMHTVWEQYSDQFNTDFVQAVNEMRN